MTDKSASGTLFRSPSGHRQTFNPDTIKLDPEIVPRYVTFGTNLSDYDIVDCEALIKL